MEVFMSRAKALRETWLQYSLVLPDTELIVQVFRQLDHSWRQAVAVRHQGREPEEMSWAVVKDTLLKEDVSRQQSAITTSSAACLPLGYKLHTPRATVAAATSSTPPQDSLGEAARVQAQKHSKGQGKGKSSPAPPSSSAQRQQQQQGLRPPLVC